MLVDTLCQAAQVGGGDAHVGPVRGPRGENSRGALSANTERAVRSDLAIYRAWCTERGVTGAARERGGHRRLRRRHEPGCGRRRRCAATWRASRARTARWGWKKTMKSEPVRRALKRMHRRKGRRQEQAKGLTGALRERLLDAAGDALIDARNRALLAVAYDTLLRRGELVALQVSDIVEEVDGAATVLVRRGKADPEGRGAMVYLARDSMALVREWLERSAITQGRVFRSLSRGVVGEGLEAGQVSRIFKRMARDGDLPGEVVEHISGHSTRVGLRRTWWQGG